MIKWLSAGWLRRRKGVRRWLDALVLATVLLSGLPLGCGQSPEPPASQPSRPGRLPPGPPAEP